MDNVKDISEYLRKIFVTNVWKQTCGWVSDLILLIKKLFCIYYSVRQTNTLTLSKDV